MHVPQGLIVESYKKIWKILVVKRHKMTFSLGISIENRGITFLWLSQKQGPPPLFEILLFAIYMSRQVTYVNKNAFQSKAHLPLANRK